MTTYSQPLLRTAAIVASAIVAIGHVGSASAQSASSEDTLARCQQLFSLWSRHNTDGYAKPLDVRMALEECQKGKIASGVATLKRALERAQIPIPPVDSGVAQTPAAPAPTLRPRGEQRRLAQ
jgi:hypothetical protein